MVKLKVKLFAPVIAGDGLPAGSGATGPQGVREYSPRHIKNPPVPLKPVAKLRVLAVEEKSLIKPFHPPQTQASPHHLGHLVRAWPLRQQPVRQPIRGKEL
jgi:hypothetical protein